MLGGLWCLSHAIAVWFIYSLTLAFYFKRLNLRFKNHKIGVHSWRLTRWTKNLSIINLIIFGIYSKSKNPHRLFVEGTSWPTKIRHLYNPRWMWWGLTGGHQDEHFKFEIIGSQRFMAKYGKKKMDNPKISGCAFLKMGSKLQRSREQTG